MNTVVKTIVFQVSEKKLKRFEYAGGSWENVEKVLRNLLEGKLHEVLLNAEIDEDNCCIECGTAFGFSPHGTTCKFHPDNMPKDLR